MLAASANLRISSALKRANGSHVFYYVRHVVPLWWVCPDNFNPRPFSSTWNPSATRSVDNFNPFEKNEDGNSCDTSGFYPGEGKYSDPIRPDTSYAIMQAEAKVMAEINAAPPKAGQPGIGNYQGFNKM